METTLTEKDKLRKLIELAVKNGWDMLAFTKRRYLFRNDVDIDNIRIMEWSSSPNWLKVEIRVEVGNSRQLVTLDLSIVELLFDPDFLKALVGTESIFQDRVYGPKWNLVAHSLLSTHLAGGDIISELYDITFNQK